ncbi:DUF1292 domain-containing protein [uncultured Clostridium sp.]|uniref:DUF1292 domain-containing protein n=1 Tax=uncultured Clostridium sp. TaxID=59620 RepID=UPI00262EC5F2|nr:DUF1292 domain-containing protein [uncultured Clostridium sp.]
MQNDVQFIEVVDENGNEEKLEIVTFLEIEDLKTEYVIAIKDGEEEAVVFKVLKDEEGNEELVTIENEAEFAMVEEAYGLLMQDEE